MSITDDQARFLFDTVIASLNFGSGFFDHEEVVKLRAIAVELGVDVMEATPSNFIGSFAHDYEGREYQRIEKVDLSKTIWTANTVTRMVELCKHCQRAEDDPVHHGGNMTEERPWWQ